MSLRDAIRERLDRNDIWPNRLEIDKEAEEKGLPATEIKMTFGDTIKTWTFAKANGMKNEEIADVVMSYLLKGKNNG